jgi:hypothetical protein
MCDVLSLTNSTSLTAEMIPYVPKNLYLIHDSQSPFDIKINIYLLVWCHLYIIWPPVLPLNLTYNLISLSQLAWEWTCPIQTPYFPCIKSHVHFPWLRSFVQRTHPSPRPFATFCTKQRFVGPMPNPQAGGPPLVSCVGWVPCHHGMAHPQAVDGSDSRGQLQIY